MATHTTWNNKAHGTTLARSRTSSEKATPAPRVVREHLSFFLVFALFAAALCGLLLAALGGSGVAWRGEFALWAAVPAGVLTVLARFMARKQLRG